MGITRRVNGVIVPRVCGVLLVEDDAEVDNCRGAMTDILKSNML